jgi:hypothetical protein
VPLLSRPDFGARDDAFTKWTKLCDARILTICVESLHVRERDDVHLERTGFEVGTTNDRFNPPPMLRHELGGRLLKSLEGSDGIASNPEADYETYRLHDRRLAITDAPHQRGTSIEPEVFPVLMLPPCRLRRPLARAATLLEQTGPVDDVLVDEIDCTPRASLPHRDCILQKSIDSRRLVG